jgi:hypothetical protein
VWRPPASTTERARFCDGKIAIVAGAFLGALVLRQDGEGWEKGLIDESGFNHSVYVADLDDGGKAEIDVGSEDQHELRRYRFGPKSVHANRD